MIVKEIMTKDPICITPEASVTEAKALMNKNKISKLPVVDSSNKLVGIITKNDLAKAGPSEATTLDMYEIGYLLSKLTVAKVMSKKVISVTENEVVEEAARIMVDNQVGCVPIVSSENKNLIIGIVTESDLFNLFTNIFGARQKGIRLILCLPDTPGSFSQILDKIAGLSGNVISLVTQEAEEKNMRKITIKVTGLSEKQVQGILNELSICAEDIREI